MTHGLVMKVPAATEFYDALHTEVGQRSTGRADVGLLLHVGRVADDGFEVFEIWESKEKCDSFFAEVVWPAMDAVSRTHARRGEPVTMEFEPRGLIIPSAAIAV
jgi:hypothetical protein